MNIIIEVKPLQVNKKELCYLLSDKRGARFVMPGGKCRYDKLKELFIQAGIFEVLELLNYDSIRTFTVKETEIILRAFNL